MGLAVVACNGNKPAANGETASADGAPKAMTANDYRASKAQIDSVSYLLGINFGNFIKGYNFGDDLNYSQIIKGIKDFQKAKGDYQSEDFAKQFKIDPNELNQVFNSYLEKRHNFTMLENKEAGAKFLAANKAKEGIVVTASGLQYKINKAGSANKPSAQDTVWVKYKGTLIDGTVFDETKDEAISLTLNRVVPGWTEGLQLIGEGGDIDLYIPSDLGYGEQGQQTIGPNSTLIFNVQLDSIAKYVAPAPVEEPAAKK